jgi:glucan phosphoethanolaminetransferase (alkaline phosphatase superfamily)
MIHINGFIILISICVSIIAVIIGIIDYFMLFTYLETNNRDILNKYIRKNSIWPRIISLDISWFGYLIQISDADDKQVRFYKRIYQLTFLLAIISFIFAFIFFPSNN